jgi:hypothetical protein
MRAILGWLAQFSAALAQFYATRKRFLRGEKSRRSSRRELTSAVGGRACDIRALGEVKPR